MNVFLVPFNVRRMATSLMPPEFKGAYVTCYAAGIDYADAVQKMLMKLLADGLHPEELLEPVHAMNVREWADHASEKWPDQVSDLVGQDEFEDVVRQGGVVYGPFGAYT